MADNRRSRGTAATAVRKHLLAERRLSRPGGRESAEILSPLGPGFRHSVEPQLAATGSITLGPDGTIYRALENLLVLDGERISYRALDVEQIGSVYCSTRPHSSRSGGRLQPA